MKLNKSKIFQWLKIILPVLLMLFAIHEIGKILGNVNGQEIVRELGNLDVRTLVLMAAVPLVLVFPMFFYDYFIVKKLKLKRPLKRLMKESLIINSFSNLIGFGGLIGVLLRTHYFKKKDVDSSTFFKTIASVTLFYLAGLSLFAWVLPIFYWDLPLFSERKILVIAVTIIGLYVPFLIIKAIVQLAKKTTTPRHVLGEVGLLGVSVLEWLGAIAFIFLISYMLEVPISFESLIPIFIVASCAGIVSMIPGGLGSFDLVFLWGTQSLNVPEESVLLMLLFYRVGYYIIPFLAGLALFLHELWGKLNAGFNSIPNIILERASHVTATVLVFLSGLVLLVSSAAPGAIERIKYAKEILSLPIVNVSHQVAVATGFILLALSNGISYKDRRSYRITLFVLLFAAALFILKGIQYKQALFMIFVAGLLFVSRDRFYRESYIVTWGRSLVNVCIILVITALYVVIGIWAIPTAKYPIPESMRPFFITDSGDLFWSAFIGLVVVTIVVFIEVWLRKVTQFKKISSIHHEKEIFLHLNKYGGKELSHLIFLHDKYIFWNKKKTVLFPYQESADKLVVLGDLVGKKEDFGVAIEEFVSHADYYGYTPVFYEVSDQFVPYLHGYGYSFFKLGEEGFIDLESLAYSKEDTLEIDKLKDSLQQDGYSFELLQPPFQEDLLSELWKLSDEWLDNRKEKGFSLGYFSEDYLQFAPLAVVKNGDAQIVAFSNVIPLYDAEQTISIDLMRSKKTNLPSGILDYLLLNVFTWAKSEEFKRLNVGMTPLSHIGVSHYATLTEKIAAQIIFDGQEYYNFQDVQRFKEKYANIWQPKYLAYRKRVYLPFTMLQIMILIGDNKYAAMREQVSEVKNSRKR
ncbi:bifunctional lysylphosphatidylglycerol flippase/synthetase MprF [Viridibacillus sp. YIM B01967]|uniref:Phosphatidylglycerol lysyltransferase n=1 Tax=Viridibacillus soli TaxID=2798301 RepID=A0ABS1H818_9BACL|nr:bifunctional lysylphosphatidylglycerol flippase/synthetase MprF [Viridibacillus soli]MBK3495556.1 bifunctional lysylphosphatidylglycerol flippase/synthetase MprF [Viridibacillus soli]